MTQIVVDVESDGPAPGLYSMVSFGAVIVDDHLDKTFYGKCRPISDQWIPEALAISGHTREETLTFPNPQDTMTNFANWIAANSKTNKRPYFWSDNNGYDFSFINYYFHAYYAENPFGWSSQNLNSFYKGCTGNVHASFKRYCKTKHTHHPVDDAMGMAEALVEIQKVHGTNIRFN